MIPSGYISGIGRNTGDEKLKTHLYDGDMNDPGLPMCIYGWNRSNGSGYSIYRNNFGESGICSICLRRAQLGLKGVQPSEHKTKWL